jgi:hypothetical protein
VKAILIPSKIEAPLIKNKPTHSIWTFNYHLRDKWVFYLKDN